MRRSGKLVSLSEQNIVDCSTAFGNNGCNGGLMDFAFEYIKQNHGVDTEKAYPYKGRQGKCRFRKSDIGAEDTGYTDLPGERANRQRRRPAAGDEQTLGVLRPRLLLSRRQQLSSSSSL